MISRSRFALTAIAIATSTIGTRRFSDAPTIRGVCFAEDGAADPSAAGGDPVTVAPANPGVTVVETAAVEGAGEPVVETAAVETAVAVGEGGEKAPDAEAAAVETAVAVGEGGEKAPDAEAAAGG